MGGVTTSASSGTVRDSPGPGGRLAVPQDCTRGALVVQGRDRKSAGPEGHEDLGNLSAEKM